MRAVVFSGTTEGRIFSRQLAQLGADVLVSVATPLGSEEQGSFAGIMVHCGRLTPDEMAALVQGADLCVDATHPYAVDATRTSAQPAAPPGWNITGCCGHRVPCLPGAWGSSRRHMWRIF